MTSFPMRVESNDPNFPMSVAMKYETALLPSYNGAIEFTPSDEDQIIPTANKSVFDDITIKAMPPSGTLIKTGTVEGSGTTQLQIPCEFAPDVIYVIGNLQVEPSLRGIVSVTIIKDEEIILTADASSSSTAETMPFSAHRINGYNDQSAPHATYSDSFLTIDTMNDTSSYRFNSGINYAYKLIGFDNEGSEEE